MLYQEINNLFTAIGSDLSAAESHGMATGMLCVNDRSKPEFWLGEISQDSTSIDTEARDTLISLFKETHRLLLNEDLSFDLLLPAEDTPLNERLEALREWCHGFLFGIGAANPPSILTDDSRGIVKDMTEFTKIDTDAYGEDSENDFMEITEYLRASVIYLRIELNATNSGTIH
jgi:uncharacterized protein YgfB (UPF0149 family)